MKYFKKVCVNNKVVADLNLDKDKCLNYETSTSGNFW